VACSDNDRILLTAAAARDVAGIAGMHDHKRWPLNCEVGEGSPSQTLGGPAFSTGRADDLLLGE
jgi:hypothetical protein